MHGEAQTPEWKRDEDTLELKPLLAELISPQQDIHCCGLISFYNVENPENKGAFNRPDFTSTGAKQVACVFGPTAFQIDHDVFKYVFHL